MQKALLVVLTLVFMRPLTHAQIVTGAEQMDRYLPMLKGRSVAIFANPTSVVGNSHLVDTLLKKGIRITRIFSPEHGFRGEADAGEKVANQVDPRTGIPIISLYGNKTKPTAEDLAGVDVLVYDIQDVGVRFYTYIGSMQRFMEAAIENHLPLLILDRPDPNSDVDGPVLDTAYRSFVGMQPIPVVYGMTIGEYARMLLGEGWVRSDTGFHLTIIPCRNYTHHSSYALPVKPSPNLPNMHSIYLYPSLCLFEGTVVSLGRGTSKPFQQFGNPEFPKGGYSFIPQSVPGATSPPQLGKTCYGYDLSGATKVAGMTVEWLVQAYSLYPDKEHFFTGTGKGFDRLAGGPVLRQQIIAGLSYDKIEESWKPGLEHFKTIRKKYLLYAN